MIAVAVVAAVMGVVAEYRKLLADEQRMVLSSAILAFGVEWLVIAIGKALTFFNLQVYHLFMDNPKESGRR
jgi:hypothetical protein